MLNRFILLTICTLALRTASSKFNISSLTSLGSLSEDKQLLKVKEDVQRIALARKISAISTLDEISANWETIEE